MTIELYPAVDVLGGKAVRLVQGDYERPVTYDTEPLEAARRWVEQGAQRLHLVDLDGARDGQPVNLDQLATIAAALDVPVQYGGGVRSLQSVGAALEAGAARVVLGTIAFKSAQVLDATLDRYGARVAVSVDARDGRVATHGWLEDSGLRADQAILALRKRGVQVIVYTNVDLDGTLSGIDQREVEAVAQAVNDGELIWSGGVGSLDDLRTLAAGPPNLGGVIVGKALYERRFTVSEAIEALA
ncbi:MAG: 1-(5-phosphoribosyl)-5-[(5-phosphoribosylamino)methylideneamino]imidazole-4-carboxamide isomerase [Solirubrobacterales bacterium]